MLSPVSRILAARGHTPTSFFADVFRRRIAALEGGSLTCRIPRLRHLYEQHPAMPFHFKPELFVQLDGITEFTFPNQRLTLYPGEVCIVPKGMPHGEVVRGEREAFENVVVSYYNGMVDIHVAHEKALGVPGAVEVKFFKTDYFSAMVSYLESICEFHHYDPRLNAVAIKGLLLAEFSLLLSLVVDAGSHIGTNINVVSLCQRLIHHNLQDESLSVESLATELNCTPNHLSKIFHRETGERITERINRLRIQYAIDALQSTPLSVKAIGAGCGYASSNYFCRIFRQATGRSPQQFRRDAQRIASAMDKSPAPESADVMGD